MSHIIQLASAAVDRPRFARGGHSSLAVRTDAVHVVFTSIDDTIAAVRVAGDLARAMGVPVTVIHFRTVPSVLPVDAPIGLSPVETDAFVGRLHSEGLDARVRVFLCRAPRFSVALAFKSHSVVVVAGRRSWWPTRSERWRRALEAAGHFVVFVDTSKHSARGPREDS